MRLDDLENTLSLLDQAETEMDQVLKRFKRASWGWRQANAVHNHLRRAQYHLQMLIEPESPAVEAKQGE